jgi:arsenate reductase
MLECDTRRLAAGAIGTFMLVLIGCGTAAVTAWTHGDPSVRDSLMTIAPDRTFRVLFLCTGNSARSQMAEALLNQKGKGRFEAESAGSEPAARVNPLAIEMLRQHAVPWRGHAPRSVAGLEREPWDFVITVCDRAKESCPIFPGQPIMAHWGMPDPAAVGGNDKVKRAAFRDAFLLLSRRIDLLIALPLEKLERLAAEVRVRAIGSAGLGVAQPEA